MLFVGSKLSGSFFSASASADQTLSIANTARTVRLTVQIFETGAEVILQNIARELRGL